MLFHTLSQMWPTWLSAIVCCPCPRCDAWLRDITSGTIDNIHVALSIKSGTLKLTTYCSTNRFTHIIVKIWHPLITAASTLPHYVTITTLHTIFLHWTRTGINAPFSLQWQYITNCSSYPDKLNCSSWREIGYQSTWIPESELADIFCVNVLRTSLPMPTTSEGIPYPKSFSKTHSPSRRRWNDQSCKW